MALQISANDFTIIFEANDTEQTQHIDESILTTQKTTQKTREKIVTIMKFNPFVTINFLCAECCLTREGLNWNIRKLKDEGLIRRVGPAKGGHWEVIEKE